MLWPTDGITRQLYFDSILHVGVVEGKIGFYMEGKVDFTWIGLYIEGKIGFYITIKRI